MLYAGNEPFTNAGLVHVHLWYVAALCMFTVRLLKR